MDIEVEPTSLFNERHASGSAEYGCTPLARTNRRMTADFPMPFRPSSRHGRSGGIRGMSRRPPTARDVTSISSVMRPICNRSEEVEICCQQRIEQADYVVTELVVV